MLFFGVSLVVSVLQTTHKHFDTGVVYGNSHHNSQSQKQKNKKKNKKCTNVSQHNTNITKTHNKEVTISI